MVENKMRELEDKVKEIPQNPEENYKEMEILRGRIRKLHVNDKSSRSGERDGGEK